jgi:thiol-disulfide isomerase/thioredoxin
VSRATGIRDAALRAALWTALVVGAAVAPAWAGAAPDFRATSLAGDTLQLGSFRGQVVLVDFWASWCPPCREQLQRLAALEKQVPGVVVLAVNVDSRRDKVEAYAKRFALPRRVVLDPQGTIAARYAVQGMPWTVIVDPRGNVASARGGWGEADVAKLTAEVRRLAAGSSKQTSASFAPK